MRKKEISQQKISETYDMGLFFEKLRRSERKSLVDLSVSKMYHLTSQEHLVATNNAQEIYTFGDERDANLMVRSKVPAQNPLPSLIVSPPEPYLEREDVSEIKHQYQRAPLRLSRPFPSPTIHSPPALIPLLSTGQNSALSQALISSTVLTISCIRA
jgi:hypothetical protein